MILHALDLPDELEALPAWLEEQLVSLDLASLVAELSAVHGGGPDRAQSLEECLGDLLPRVLSEGLSVVPNDRLRPLLVQPSLLMELQERVLVEGGPYWDQRLPDSSGLSESIDRGWRQVRRCVDSSGPARSEQDTTVRRARGEGSFGRMLLVPLCAAALVLAAVFAVERFQQAPAVKPGGWGWSRTGGLTAELSGRNYLNQLADQADEWFARRPTTAQTLATRIAEFRQGCSTLMLSEHAALAAGDREWLVERCRAWATKLDRHLADVEAGREVNAVRNEADETVRALINALRTRAAETA